MASAIHTPTPWFMSDRNTVATHAVMRDVATNPQAVAEYCRPGDAAFIVRACNAHDDLVAALRELLDAGRDVTAKAGGDRDASDIAINRLVAAEHAADAALALADAA